MSSGTEQAGPARITFRAPAQMRAVVGCRAWSLGDVPADGCEVVVDLGSWQRLTATPVIAVVTTLARLANEDHKLRVLGPHSDYARRMLETIGFYEALQTFGSWKLSGLKSGKVRRILPIVPVQNFQSHSDVDEMANRLQEEFAASDLLPASLLQDVTTALVEAADNVVWHAKSGLRGFALAQIREVRTQGRRFWFIEVAVGDPGVGIAASFREEEDEAAIVYAMKEGTTSLSDTHRGFGLPEIESAAKAAPDRIVTVHSGNGYVVRAFADESSATVRQRFNGTLLTMGIPVNL